jgi:(2R)-phospho-3-sulfolactate synthase (ComA)
LIELVRRSGLKAKPEVGIQFGAGGATAAAELQTEGTHDPNWAITQAKRFLESGAEIVMIESEGITENVDAWRTDVPAKFIDEIGTERLMFEAADPDVFAWYSKNYGADVNLFVDHSQIVQLECLRAGRVCRHDEFIDFHGLLSVSGSSKRRLSTRMNLYDQIPERRSPGGRRPWRHSQFPNVCNWRERRSFYRWELGD